MLDFGGLVGAGSGCYQYNWGRQFLICCSALSPMQRASRDGIRKTESGAEAFHGHDHRLNQALAGEHGRSVHICALSRAS